MAWNPFKKKSWKKAGKKLDKTFNPKKNGVEKAFDKFGKQMEKGFKKFSKSGAPELIADVGTPDTISVSVQVVGNGVCATWSENDDVIKQVFEQTKSGKFDQSILWELIPDEITVAVGVELALVLSVDVGAEFTYSSQEDIKMIVNRLKKLA